MPNSKFKWTEHLIDCDRKYDTYDKNIRQGKDRDLYLSALSFAADSAKPENLAGYAAYLLYYLYKEGEYVAESIETAQKYLELGCNLNDTNCLVTRARLSSNTGEEYDQKLAEIIEHGCNREYYVWKVRSLIRERKKNDWKSKTFKPNYFLRLKYLLKAKSTLPKQKYFDSIRRRYKKEIRKMLVLPIVLAVLVILIAIFASVV